jgi:hypothetical protein
MDWKAPFVIYRIAPDGRIEEVFQAQDLKSAKYWLTYIALPGDVLCKTPLHPKHSHAKNAAEYWSHKESNREPIINEQDWRKFAEEHKFQGEFPEPQTAKSESNR